MKTMTAEEVQATAEQVRVAVNGAVSADATWNAGVALSHLAAQAARVPGLEEEVESLKTAVAGADRLWEQQQSRAEQAESERDAAQKEAAGRRESNIRLRERVATLFAESEKWKEAARAVNELHDTAEARVRELERAADAAGHMLGNGEYASAEQVLAKALRTSQPPPAPAQGKPSILDALTSLGRALRANSGGIHTSVSLEVSGDHYDAAARELAGHKYSRPVSSAGGIICETGEVPVRIVRKTNAPTPPPGLREAVAFLVEQVRLNDEVHRLPDHGLMPVKMTAAQGRAILAAFDATGGDKALCPGCKQMAPATEMYTRCTLCAAHEDERTRNDALETNPDADDAAKYRAAVERFDEATDRMPTVAQRQVREVLEWMLTLSTPPSGPGGGEDWPLPPHERCEMKCLVGRPQECAGPEMAGIRDGVRARIPLQPSLSPAPESAPDSNSPQTPAVVWRWRDEEGNAANVSADGYHLHGDVEVIAGTLARALAEAKREVATLKAAADGELKTTDADRGNASLAWGCAGSLQTALRRERASRMEFAKKAAESMRERAAQAAKTARHRVLVTDESFGVYAMACEDIEISIRRLPLEAP